MCSWFAINRLRVKARLKDLKVKTFLKWHQDKLQSRMSKLHWVGNLTYLFELFCAAKDFWRKKSNQSQESLSKSLSTFKTLSNTIYKNITSKGIVLNQRALYGINILCCIWIYFYIHNDISFFYRINTSSSFLQT